MTALAAAIRAFEQTPVPDKLTLLGIDYLCGAADKRLSRLPPETERLFAKAMLDHPIAENTEEANEQHYELPAEFFELALGPHRKYSSCLYREPTDTLGVAEARALEETCEHADLRDGQEVLELGCGWGSLSLWMAQHYPGSRIVSVSNSQSQRRYIEAKAAELGLTNLQIVTADMNAFDADAALDGRRFDRVVSVEMFEHMSNWPALLSRVRGWMKPEGKLFLHVFTHRTTPYSFDRNDARIREILADVYGAQAKLWRRRWRLFFLSVAGLFGHNGGADWGVSHYRLAVAPDPRSAND